MNFLKKPKINLSSVIFLLLAASLPFFFACSKDSEPEPPVSLPLASVSLHPGDTYLIEPQHGAGSYTFLSNNTYTVTVSDSGLVKAGKVGEALIEVSAEIGSAELTVTVNPRHNLYNEPVHHFNMTQSQVFNDLGLPDNSSGNLVAYNSSAPAVDFYGYLFDDNDMVSASYVMIYTSFSSRLSEFLAERYLTLTMDDEFIYMLNGNTDHPPTLMIAVGVYDIMHYIVMYLPYSSEESASFTNSVMNFRQSIKSSLHPAIQ